MSYLLNIGKILCQARCIGKVETLVRMLHAENWEKQLKFVNANGISLNSQDENGETILMKASMLNRLDVVKFLVEECKVDANHKDSCGQKAFHTTTSEEIQIYLLRHGTLVHPIMLHFAVRDNYLQVVQVLINLGFDINFRDPQNETPLALGRSDEMCTLLKNNGATI